MAAADKGKLDMKNTHLLSHERPRPAARHSAGWSALHRRGFLAVSCKEGCGAGGPRRKPLLIPGHMASIPWLTSWYKVAAAASAITSAFPPAGRKERKGKERLGTLPFKGLHTTPWPLPLPKPYLPATSSYKRSWRKRFYFEQSCTQLKYELEKWQCKSLSSVQLCATPWTVALQAPLSMGFSRQEYWSGWPCPPPEDLPDPGMEPVSLMSPSLAERFFTTRAIWEVPAKLWECCYERREKTNVGGSQQPLSQPIIRINVVNLLNLNAKSDPSCNCGFQITVLYQYWFINCKKFIILRQYVNNKENSVSLDKYMMMFTHHYSHAEKFPSPTNPCPIYAPRPTITYLFTVPITVPFPECHTVGITVVDFSDWLPSLNNMHLSFF